MMMMMTTTTSGDGGQLRYPTVHVPPWSLPFENMAAGTDYHLTAAAGGGGVGGQEFPFEESTFTALQRQLSCKGEETGAEEEDVEEPASAVDVYSSDEFRMYEFKVRRCARGRSHDWTECPFAHPGEKARRRDPRKYHYSGAACPDFRKGGCKRGDACEFAHGVFECWLHPARYRTQPCKDGTACRRRVCFFAHTPDQLRVLPHQQQQQTPTNASATVESYDGSPLLQQAMESYISKHLMSSSPTSTLMSPPISPPSNSPPMSPSTAALRRASWSVGTSPNEIVASMRQLQLSKAKSAPSSWGFQLGSTLFGSPRGTGTGLRADLCGLPSIPTTPGTCVGGLAWLDDMGGGLAEGEEPVERVESGRALRAKIFEKLSKECCVAKRAEPPAPDVGWVSELVKERTVVFHGRP